MKIKTIIYSLTILLFALFINSGCNKFLDEKTIKSYTVPSKLVDLQALLDYSPTMVQSDLASGEVSSDDYYLTDAVWTALSSEYLRKMYYWQRKDIFVPGTNDWSIAYRAVFVANEVLSDLKKMERKGQENTWDNISGQAYFYRAKTLLQVINIWTMPYDEAKATSDLGIPLRLVPDFNAVSVRATLQESYAQVIADLKQAAAQLPPLNANAYRPSKSAAFGLLARTYLNMRNYQQAGLYADSCLQLKSTLLNYNTLSTSAAYPFVRLNDEVIADGYAGVPTPLNPTRAKISEELYGLYEPNDLRKVLYFKTNSDQTHAFKGGYSGLSALFTGIAVDEMFLIRAECKVRQNHITAGLADLNTLVLTRYKTGTFVPQITTDKDIALDMILKERRKELLMRCLRWTDLKRLNKEGRNIILTRNLNGITYTLQPNSLGYALPIPEDVIQLSGMPQNP